MNNSLKHLAQPLIDIAGETTTHFNKKMVYHLKVTIRRVYFTKLIPVKLTETNSSQDLFDEI